MAAALRLATQAAGLATQLNTLSESCNHESITQDIANIAKELTLLSTTLCRLHEAIVINESAYTDAFREDLNEITDELRMIFEEVDECCLQLQKADSNSFAGVSWFFKKGRVDGLSKHLEALKTTVVVMRTVLYHGKDYGVQTSPGRLAEATPHTMSEDRAILESIFAKNRNAIISAQNKGESRGHKHSASTSSEHNLNLSPGAHGRNLSLATGVDSISVPDVLPPKDGSKSRSQGNVRSLRRRFSKRSGLGVHKSILRTRPTDTESTLRMRWIKKGQLGKPMPSISENTSFRVSGSMATGKDADDDIEESDDEKVEANASKSRSNSLTAIGSSIGRTIGRAMRGLSFDKHKTNQGNPVNSDNAVSLSKKLNISTSERLKQKFAKPELTTPDYEREFDNGV